MHDLPVLPFLKFPSLKTVVSGGWAIEFERLGVSTLSFPALLTVEGAESGIFIQDCLSLTSVNFVSLTSVRGAAQTAFTFLGNTAITALSLPALTSFGEAPGANRDVFVVQGNTKLASIQLLVWQGNPDFPDGFIKLSGNAPTGLCYDFRKFLKMPKTDNFVVIDPAPVMACNAEAAAMYISTTCPLCTISCNPCEALTQPVTSSTTVVPGDASVPALTVLQKDLTVLGILFLEAPLTLPPGVNVAADEIRIVSPVTLDMAKDCSLVATNNLDLTAITTITPTISKPPTVANGPQTFTWTVLTYGGTLGGLDNLKAANQARIVSAPAACESV